MSNEMLIGILMAAIVIAFALGAMAAYVRMRGTRIDFTPPETIKPTFRVMAAWCRGKHCAICGREIPALSHFGPQPGLMSGTPPDVETIAWHDVPPDRLPQMLETHKPVCSSCQLVSWLQHEHADLLLDRHRTQELETKVH